MMPRISPFFLTLWSVVTTVVLAADGGSLTERQCRKASNAACAWIAHLGDRSDNTAHIGKACEAKGVKCVYHTTCHVFGTARDLYFCKEHGHHGLDKDKRVHLGHEKHTGKHFPHKVQSKNALLLQLRDRGKSTEDAPGGGRSRRSLKTNVKLGKKSNATAYEMPYLFQRIMQRHRSFNANAFNGGTYFLNGHSYVKKAPPQNATASPPQNVTTAGT